MKNSALFGVHHLQIMLKIQTAYFSLKFFDEGEIHNSTLHTDDCGASELHVKSYRSGMRIIFVEGIPGSGKSTMAEKLCASAVKSGRDARWYLEESHDHPIHPKPWRTSKSQEDFVEKCIRSWSNFVEEWEDKGTLHIMEGSAFQSTVRFMMENRLPGIGSYYRRFEIIVSRLEPRMVYLRPADVTTYSKNVCTFRGNGWSTKVSEYLARTDYSAHHELSGLEGMHRFWNEYAQLCDMLVEQTSIPTKTIGAVQSEWERHMTEAVTFLGLRGLDNALCEQRFNTSMDTAAQAGRSSWR